MGMPEHVRAVLKGKRILLMKEMATSMKWPDMGLFDEMIAGFRLVGTFGKHRNNQKKQYSLWSRSKVCKKRLKLCFQKQSATYDSCGREVEETLH